MLDLQKTQKLDKFQARLTNKNKKDTFINPSDIKKTTRRYCTQLLVSKFVYLDKMGKLQNIKTNSHDHGKTVA